MDIIEWIETKFTYQSPTDEQVVLYGQLRSKAKEMAYLIEQACPDTHDRQKAFDALRETVMWANASIATEVREEEL